MLVTKTAYVSSQDGDHDDMQLGDYQHYVGCSIAGFQEVAIVPPLFVLMGNFHSKAPAVAGCMSAAQRAGGGGAAQAVDFMELKAGFAALAKLIDRFPRIKVSWIPWWQSTSHGCEIHVCILTSLCGQPWPMRDALLSTGHVNVGT